MDISSSNSHAFDFADGNVVLAAVIKASGFGVGVSCHSLRNFQLAAVGEVVGDAGGTEGGFRCQLCAC